MENFRPPAMEEVKKERKRNKIIIAVVVFFCFFGVGLGVYVGSTHLAYYFNQLTSDSKSQLLKDYFQAISDGDIDKQRLIAPDFSLEEIYPFLSSKGEYLLFMFVDQSIGDNVLLFNIIDQSLSPYELYFTEVSYDADKYKRLVITNIKILRKGYQVES